MTSGPAAAARSLPARGRLDRNELEALGRVLAAASLWAFGAIVAKRWVIGDGVGALDVAQLRALTGGALLLAVLAAWRPATLRVDRRALVVAACYGVGGLVTAQAGYYIAIERLPVGVALTIQYLAPIAVCAIGYVFLRERGGPLLFVAAGVAALGTWLITAGSSGGPLDGIGVAASFVSAAGFAAVVLIGRWGTRRAGLDPGALVAYGLVAAAIAWSIARPWWNFPWSEMDLTAWLGLIWIAAFATAVPFTLMAGATNRVAAGRAAIAATWEPVAGAVLGALLLSESMGLLQIAGAALVLSAVALSERSAARPAPPPEPTPDPQAVGRNESITGSQRRRNASYSAGGA